MTWHSWLLDTIAVSAKTTTIFTKTYTSELHHKQLTPKEEDPKFGDKADLVQRIPKNPVGVFAWIPEPWSASQSPQPSLQVFHMNPSRQPNPTLTNDLQNIAMQPNYWPSSKPKFWNFPRRQWREEEIKIKAFCFFASRIRPPPTQKASKRLALLYQFINKVGNVYQLREETMSARVNNPNYVL